MDLLIARNPDPDSRLPYLLRLPVGDGLVFATRETWPRTSGLYCHPLPLEAWADDLDEVERIPLRACTRRGAAIDVVADRGRENRSQIVYTRARGREMVFWQSPRTRKQSRPGVNTPTARAAGLRDLEILVDSQEKYPYRFPQQTVSTRRRGLTCGDYAVERDGRTVAAVERKSMADLIASLTSGRLRYALTELATLPRAAVVVEEPYSKVFASAHVRPALVADGLAEIQIAWPSVPIVYCETRKLAEEWTYRWLSAAYVWAGEQAAADAAVSRPVDRGGSVGEGGSVDGNESVGGEGPVGGEGTAAEGGPTPPLPRELRAWARERGMDVPDRGRLRPEILEAWRAEQAHCP